MPKPLSPLTIAALASLSLVACGKPAAGPEAAATSAAAPAPVAASAAAAPVFEGNAPAFAPNYPATPNTNAAAMGPTAGAFNFETADTPAQVADYYAGLAKTAGLTARETNGAYNTVYSAEGPAGGITVQASAANGKTSVGVTWSKSN